MQALPKIVSADEWQRAHEELLAKEKELTRAQDALAAERRRQPMTKMDPGYRFAGPNGTVALHDLFDGRRQLAVYHFMFGPGETEPCAGCSGVLDNIGRLEHLNARDTTFAAISRAPLPELDAYKQRMGWHHIPWYSSAGSSFNEDLGLVTPNGGEMFAFSVFLKDDDDNVYRTYVTGSRGIEAMRPDFNILDRTPYGRQETWEDSPEGWPQSEPYLWWNRHDEYATA